MPSQRTTIQVDGETLLLLDQLKRTEKADSYAQVIRDLIRRAKQTRPGERGSLPRLREFRREKRDRLA